MVSFVNPWTGTETLVADERKDEYLRAGFKLALEAQKPKEEPVKRKRTKKK